MGRKPGADRTAESHEWNTSQGKKRAHLKHRYGITLEDFNQMLLEQEGLCAICRTQSKLNVDHDHETGRVRGLLCKRCNLAMHLIDNHLAACLSYLAGSHGLPGETRPIKEVV